MPAPVTLTGEKDEHLNMPWRPPTHRPNNIQPVVRGTTTTHRLSGRKGQTRRERLLQKWPVCKSCDDAGRTTATAELDHVVPLWDGGIDHESNMQGLCHACHADKTAREQLRRRAVS